MRNSIISCTEILSYDLAKSTLTGPRFGLEDAMPAHLCSGFFAGFAATSLGSPADVIGTKVMQKRGGASLRDVNRPRAPHHRTSRIH